MTNPHQPEEQPIEQPVAVAGYGVVTTGGYGSNHQYGANKPAPVDDQKFPKESP